MRVKQSEDSMRVQDPRTFMRIKESEDSMRIKDALDLYEG